MVSIVRETALKDGSKLVVRKPAVEDAEELLAYLSVVGGESDNLLFGKGEVSVTLEQEREFIQKRLEDKNALWLLGYVDDALISMGNIGCLPKPRNQHNAEIGLTVKKEYWGRGIAQVMLEEIVRFAREHGGIKNVHLGVRKGNDAAIHIYEKFGFKKIGTHRDYFCINGAFHDLDLMDLSL